MNSRDHELSPGRALLSQIASERVRDSQDQSRTARENALRKHLLRERAWIEKERAAERLSRWNGAKLFWQPELINCGIERLLPRAPMTNGIAHPKQFVRAKPLAKCARVTKLRVASGANKKAGHA